MDAKDVLESMYKNDVESEDSKMKRLIQERINGVKGKVTEEVIAEKERLPQVLQPVLKDIDQTNYNINDIVSELITHPSTLRFRIKIKDSVERVLSILLRYQHLMQMKAGISRGEICRNLSVKYRSNLDYILMELEQHGVISITTIKGKNFYKINVTSVQAAVALHESLSKELL